MALVAEDRVKVNTTTTGTQAFGLGSAVSTAFQDFSSIADGSTVHYVAYTATEFECGEGVYSLAAQTLTRATIYASSNSNLIVTFGSSPTLIVSHLAIDAKFLGLTVTGADAGADTLFGWDESATAYKNIASADLTEETAPASGDYLVTYRAEGDLTKVNYSKIPLSGFTVTGADAGADTLFGWDESANAYKNIASTDLAEETAPASGDYLVAYRAEGNLAKVNYSQFVDYVNVKNYGATGDGVTNDYTAIQNAITANPGRTIYFPAGTYKFNTGLSITDSGTSLMGDGSGSILLYGATTGTAIFFNGVSAASRLGGCNVTRINLYIAANNTATGIYAEFCQTLHLTHVLIGEFDQCLFIHGSRNIVCTNCDFYNATYNLTGGTAGTACVTITGTATQDEWFNYFTNCTIGSTNKDYGLYIRAGDAFRCDHCYFAHGGVANVYLQVPSGSENEGFSFTDCYFDHDSSPGAPTFLNIGLYILTAAGSSADGVYEIQSCFFNGEKFGLIADGTLKRMGTVKVHDCQFMYMDDGSGGSSSKGISINDCDQVMVTGCSFYSMLDGMYVEDCDSMTVNNNNFHTISNDAIILGGTIPFGTLVGNVFYNVTSDELVNGTTSAGIVKTGNSPTI